MKYTLFLPIYSVLGHPTTQAGVTYTTTGEPITRDTTEVWPETTSASFETTQETYPDETTESWPETSPAPVDTTQEPISYETTEPWPETTEKVTSEVPYETTEYPFPYNTTESWPETTEKATTEEATTEIWPETTNYPITSSDVRPSAYSETAIYLEFNFDWNNIQGEIQDALSWGYTKFYIGYYMSINGCFSACRAWLDLPTATKQSIKTMLSSYGAEIFLSIGGPTEFMEGLIESGIASSFGQDAGAFAAQNYFDGVDVAIALSGEPTPDSQYLSLYASSGQFAQAARDIVSGVKISGTFNSDQVQLTSHAPYFSTAYMNGNFTNSLGSLAVETSADQPWFVNKIGLETINEGGRYSTYDDIFVSNSYYPGGAVQEIVRQGIDKDSVFVIKPVADNIEMVRNDFVPISTLAGWGCQFFEDFGWYGGFLGYTWNNINGQDVQNFGQSLQLGQCP